MASCGHEMSIKSFTCFLGFFGVFWERDRMAYSVGVVVSPIAHTIPQLKRSKYVCRCRTILRDKQYVHLTADSL